MQGGGQGDPGLVEVFVRAIGNGAVVVERGVNGLDLQQHGVNTAHIQEGFLLPGKGGVRQVFRRGRGSHRDRRVPFLARGHGRIGHADGLCQAFLQRGARDPAPDFPPGLGQLPHIIHIEAVQPGLNARLKIIVREKVHKGGRGGGVAVRHADAQGAQLTEHLAERGILAADRGHIAHA